MCRKHLKSSWLIFFGLICIPGLTESHFADEFDEEGDNYLIQQESDEESPEFKKEIYISKRDPAFTPYISIGALSNMQQFFENLKENFHSLEKLSQEERKALLGKHEQSAGECDHHRRKQSSSALSYPHTRKYSYRKHVTLINQQMAWRPGGPGT